MKKYVFIALSVALAFMSSVDAYISEWDIAYTSAIMKKMDANFVDAFVLWRGGFFSKMRKNGNIDFVLHQSGESLIDARNEGNDAVMKLLVTLFPSNSGLLEIVTVANSNFAKAIRSLTVKTQAQIIAKLLKACKTINDTGKDELNIERISKQISDQIAKMLDFNVIINPDCKLSPLRDIIKRVVSLVCASSAFEKEVEMYKEHMTESLILGFCCFNFHGLVGVRTLLNAFVEEGLIDSLDDDLQDVTQDMYTENIKKLITAYKKTDNIEPLLEECEATDLFGTWMSYEKFQSIFEGKAENIKTMQERISELQKNRQAERNKIKKTREDLNNLVTELVDTEIPGLSANFHDELIAFLKNFDWNNGSDFSNDPVWKKKKFDKYFGEKFSKKEFVDFCRKNKDDSDKILSKINEAIEKQEQLPVSTLLARFYSNYSERVDKRIADLETRVKKYTETRNIFSRLNMPISLKKEADKTEKISTEDSLILTAGKLNSLVPYPTTGDFEQNLRIKINGENFADCVETTIRHLVSMMCEYDSKTGTVKVPENFNTLTKEFFKRYGDKTSYFNSRDIELHIDWVKMLSNIPNWVNVVRTDDGDLESDSENIKNVLAFLTTDSKEEYETQRKKDLIDILNNGRKDATFAIKKHLSDTGTVIVLRKNGGEKEEFPFILGIGFEHSCLAGLKDSTYSTFAYEISDISNDTGRLYVSSSCPPTCVGRIFFHDAEKDIERRLMLYFLENAHFNYSINNVVWDVLSKMRNDIGNANYADWLKSMIESDKERCIVSVAQAAVNNTSASDDTIFSIITQIVNKTKKNPRSTSNPEVIASEIVDGVITSLQMDKTTIANIIIDACYKVIKDEDEDDADAFRSLANDLIKNFEKKTSYEVFRDIIKNDIYDVKSPVVTEENLQNCGVNVNNAQAVVVACNVIKAVVVASIDTKYTPIDFRYNFPETFAMLDFARQNYGDLSEYFGIDLMNERNYRKVVKGYLSEISNCDDTVKPKLLHSLKNFIETLERSYKTVVISPSESPVSLEEAGLLIGLNQISHVDAKLFESLKNVLILKIHDHKVPLTNKACPELFLIGYLHNLANSKPALVSKLKAEMAEIINELGDKKVEIPLFDHRTLNCENLLPHVNFILASLKLIENDSDLSEKLEKVINLEGRNGVTSIKSALENHFNKAVEYIKEDRSGSNILENLKNMAGVKI